MAWAMRLAKIGLLVGAVAFLGWWVAVFAAAGMLLWLMLISEPDITG
jgi:hypothetical protein